MEKRKWWQERCPWDWKDKRTHYHFHHCRWAAEGIQHTHVCDCGEVYEEETGKVEADPA